MSEEIKKYYSEMQNYFKLKAKEYDKTKSIEDKKKDIIEKVKDQAKTLEDLEKKRLEKISLDKKTSEKDQQKALKKAGEIQSTEDKSKKIIDQIIKGKIKLLI